MELPVSVIRCWSRSGKSLSVILDDGKRSVWVPKWAMVHDYKPGERDIIMEVRYGEWAREMVENEYRASMKENT